jgi:hypothetical protein
MQIALFYYYRQIKIKSVHMIALSVGWGATALRGFPAL